MKWSGRYALDRVVASLKLLNGFYTTKVMARLKGDPDLLIAAEVILDEIVGPTEPGEALSGLMARMHRAAEAIAAMIEAKGGGR